MLDKWAFCLRRARGDVKAARCVDRCNFMLGIEWPLKMSREVFSSCTRPQNNINLETEWYHGFLIESINSPSYWDNSWRQEEGSAHFPCFDCGLDACWPCFAPWQPSRLNLTEWINQMHVIEAVWREIKKESTFMSCQIPFKSSANSSGDAFILFGVSGVCNTNVRSLGDVGIRISSRLRFVASFSWLWLFFECLSLVSEDVRFGDLSTDKWLSNDSFLLSFRSNTRSLSWSMLLGNRRWLDEITESPDVGTGLDTVRWCVGRGRELLVWFLRDFVTRLKKPLPRELVESSEQFDFFRLKLYDKKFS